MQPLCADLLDEYADLAALADGLSADAWRRPTAFFDWSPWDEVAHLCYFDEAGLLAIRDRAAFQNHAAELMQQMRRGESISQLARERYAGLEGPALLARWRQHYTELADKLASLDARDRLPWYGPDMSARSFATARLMETWAHGQDIHDLLCRRRGNAPRLRHIAHLGATTFGWTFANRGLVVPDPAPRIELTGPGGDAWIWNPGATEHFVRGSAEDFCLVVTQRRHLADTGLHHGGNATAWLQIAQCFAGPPAEPPPPGRRRVDYGATTAPG